MMHKSTAGNWSRLPAMNQTKFLRQYENWGKKGKVPRRRHRRVLKGGRKGDKN